MRSRSRGVCHQRCSLGQKDDGGDDRDPESGGKRQPNGQLAAVRWGGPILQAGVKGFVAAVFDGGVAAVLWGHGMVNLRICSMSGAWLSSRIAARMIKGRSFILVNSSKLNQAGAVSYFEINLLW